MVSQQLRSRSLDLAAPGKEADFGTTSVLQMYCFAVLRGVALRHSGSVACCASFVLAPQLFGLRCFLAFIAIH